MNQQIQLDVTGMTCDGCEGHVNQALAQAGLTDIEVDWRRGSASGIDVGSFDIAKAIDALEGTDYEIVSTATRDDQTPSSDSDSDTEYDLLILGSGSAAFGAAIKARDLGASVAIIERGTIGGTCVNIGCVPSKALLRPAERYHEAGHSPFVGVPTSAGELDLAALIESKDELVGVLRQEKYAKLLEVYGIDFIQGTARFSGPSSVEVDGRTVTAHRYLIATGASSWVPPIDGLGDVDYLTSTTALELTELPGELIVVGANAIGLELGQLFTHLGSKVTWVEALERIAPFEEPEISAILREHLESEGATLYEQATALEAGTERDRVWIDIDANGETIRLEADRLLMATGRRANTTDMGLELAGIDLDDHGSVIVDAGLATSNPSVWAAGDVTTTPQFVYVAASSGNMAAENALRSTGRVIDLRTMPRVTFTTPAIASVGLTEAAAADEGRVVATSTLPLDAVPRAIVNRDTTGVVKLVADDSTGELLGAHVLAEGAGDVIQAAVVAMNYHATVDEIAAMFHPYLTMAEALKLAAQTFSKDVANLSCCAS